MTDQILRPPRRYHGLSATYYDNDLEEVVTTEILTIQFGACGCCADEVPATPRTCDEAIAWLEEQLVKIRTLKATLPTMA